MRGVCVDDAGDVIPSGTAGRRRCSRCRYWWLSCSRWWPSGSRRWWLSGCGCCYRGGRRRRGRRGGPPRLADQHDGAVRADHQLGWIPGRHHAQRPSAASQLRGGLQIGDLAAQVLGTLREVPGTLLSALQMIGICGGRRGQPQRGHQRHRQEHHHQEHEGRPVGVKAVGVTTAPATVGGHRALCTPGVSPLDRSRTHALRPRFWAASGCSDLAARRSDGTRRSCHDGAIRSAARSRTEAARGLASDSAGPACSAPRVSARS
jgi:hypothetical protein